MKKYRRKKVSCRLLKKPSFAERLESVRMHFPSKLESVRMHFPSLFKCPLRYPFHCPVERLESVRIGKCQNVFSLKLESVRMRFLQNWKVSECIFLHSLSAHWDSLSIARLRNWKVSELESVRMHFPSKLESVRIRKCLKNFEFKNSLWMSQIML